MIDSLDTFDEALSDIVDLDRVQVERRQVLKITELYLKTCDVEMDSDYDSPLARCVNQIAYDAVSKGEYIQEARSLLERALSWIEQEAEYEGAITDDLLEFLYPNGKLKDPNETCENLLSSETIECLRVDTINGEQVFRHIDGRLRVWRLQGEIMQEDEMDMRDYGKYHLVHPGGFILDPNTTLENCLGGVDRIVLERKEVVAI